MIHAENKKLTVSRFLELMSLHKAPTKIQTHIQKIIATLKPIQVLLAHMWEKQYPLLLIKLPHSEIQMLIPIYH